MPKKSFPEPVEALVLILSIFSGLIIISVIYSSLSGFEIQQEAFNKSARFFYIFGGSLFIFVPLIYSWLKQYKVRSLFRFNRVPGPVIFLSIISGLSLSVVGDELDRVINKIIPIPDWFLEQLQPLQAESALDWVLVIIGAVLIASIAEEVLFRGFFQVTLEHKGDVTRAVLLSSITWTMIHMNPFWIIQIFITGIIIGFLAWRTDSIIPSVIVHIINNLLAVLFINLDLEEALSWYLWGDHVSPVVVVFAAGVLVWSLRQISFIYRKA